MTYYLAVDLGRSKLPDKSDRFIKIDIASLQGLTQKEVSSLPSIIDFTSKYDSESDMMEDLIIKGCVDFKYYDKHFTICYKSPKKEHGINEWTRCGKKNKNQSAVLFKNEAELFDVGSFVAELSSKLVNPSQDFKYVEATPEEIMNIALLTMLCQEILQNDFYKYDNAAPEAEAVLHYLNDIKNYNYINTKYIHMALDQLVCHIAYKYDKFDTEKIYPLKDKNGSRVTKDRHLLEIVLFYVYCCREMQSRLDEKSKQEATASQSQTYETIELKENTFITAEEKPLIRQRKKENNNDEYEQLSLFDLLDKKE